jgi:DNA-binding CsgD family transcriptional regulator
MTITATYNKHQVYGILKNYYWMLREIQRINSELSRTDFKGVAQYGTSASLPTGQGLVSKTLENEVVRRTLKSERMLDYIDKVNFINANMYKVIDEKEKVILDCLLDGLTISAISKHLGTNRKQVNIQVDNIISCLVD